MHIIAHIVAAGAAFTLFTTVGYGFLRRLAFPNDRLRFVGVAVVLMFVMLLPFALALVVNSAFGMDDSSYGETMIYLFTTLPFFGTLRARGVDVPF